MEISANLIDGVVIGVIFLSAILAWSRGFMREGLGLIGWVLAGLGAAAAAPFLMPHMAKLPVVGGMVAGNCNFSLGVAFFVAFAVILGVLAVLTPALGDAVRDSALGGLDKVLGFLFGVARGVLIVGVAAWALHALFPSVTSDPAMQEARTGGFLTDLRDGITRAIPTEMPAWATGRMGNLMSVCAAPAPADAPPTEL